MYASKENARRAHEALISLESLLDDESINKDLVFIEDFLIAAEQKLPTEATYRQQVRSKARTSKLGRKRTRLANG